MNESFTDRLIHDWKFWALGLIFVVFMLMADSCDGGTGQDESQTDQQLQQYQRVQPVPKYDWSQIRATLISVEDAQAKGTATTSFFFEAGVAQPVRTCDSIGYAVPSTAQITNPDQRVYEGTVISQMEPTGIYTGDSQGTFVVCLVNGNPTPTYWEGEVAVEGGPAKWDDQQHKIVSTGPASVTVQTK